jgi:hypothetical protein
MIEAVLYFVFELLFELALALAGGVLETKLADAGKRFWMWVLGLALIGLVFWWRGFQIWPPYIFAGLMIGFLCYLQWSSTRPDE